MRPRLHRTLVAVVSGAVALAAVGGCSSSPDAERAPAPATTGPAPTEVTPPTEPPVPEVTLPERASAAFDLPNLDAVERACLGAGVNEQVAANPSVADTDDTLAIVVGGVLSTCVPPGKLSASILTGFTSIPPGSELSADQQACVQGQLGTGDLSVITMFVGGIAMARPASIRAGAGPIDQACGTAMATSS